MNRFEVIKMGLNPSSLEQQLARWIEIGIERVPKDDLERLKWHGLFYRTRQPGTFMLRIRTFGGELNAGQLLTLGEIARQFGRKPFGI
jgi:ferredoxin-nitrite reductase